MSVITFVTCVQSISAGSSKYTEVAKCMWGGGGGATYLVCGGRLKHNQVLWIVGGSETFFEASGG